MHINRYLFAPVIAATAVAGCGASSSAKSNDTIASASATTASAASAAPGTIDVKLTEWGIAPSVASPPAGKVTFDVTNDGKVPHEMVVVKTGKQADALGKGARVSEAGSKGEASDIAPGASKKVTLTLPAGHYALICNLPGHYSSGMHADFTVGQG